MGLFRRKPRPPNDWPLPVIAAHFVECFHGHPDARDVRAVGIFHLDPALAPLSDMQEIANREAAQIGEEPVRMTEWHVFKLEFVDDDEGADRVALFMEFDATTLIRDRVTCETLEEARQEAIVWIGDGVEHARLRALPGFFQRALVIAVVGRYLDNHTSDFMWAPEYDESATAVAVRKYPPDVSARDQPEWNLLPREAIEALFDSRGW